MLSSRSRKTGKSKISWSPSAFQILDVIASDKAKACVFNGTSSGLIETSETQVTRSEGHPLDHHGKRVGGGPFYTSRTGSTYTAPHSAGQVGSLVPEKGIGPCPEVKWDGPVLFPISAETIHAEHAPKPRSQNLSDLDAFGATAISRCSPANPASELGTGASELYREGLPSLPGIPSWRQRTAVAKGAGSEYLNKEFGWDPLIGEVKSFASTVRQHRDLLNQYYHNAGSNVRRTFNFPIEKEETPIAVLTGQHCSVARGSTTAWQSIPCTISITSSTSIRRWFSGAFTYDVPSQSDSWKKALGYGSDADVLFGASLNPELLWNLTPWSWAVDWFTNAGDVINNISNYVRAGQIMRYGYMMEERKTSTIMSASSSGWKKIGGTPYKESYSITKVRQPANPYGFGVSSEGLSPTQILIAAALGITLL